MFNANNYGYNPYGTYIPQRPMQQSNVNENYQPVNNSYKLNGKQVESIDVVKAMDIPLDGSISYFPLADKSAIVTKQLQNDGTSKIIIYKQSKDNTKDIPKYATVEDINNAINKIDLSDIDDLKDDIKDLKKDIKDLKKKKVSD